MAPTHTAIGAAGAHIAQALLCLNLVFIIVVCSLTVKPFVSTQEMTFSVQLSTTESFISSKELLPANISDAPTRSSTSGTINNRVDQNVLKLMLNKSIDNDRPAEFDFVYKIKYEMNLSVHKPIVIKTTDKPTSIIPVSGNVIQSPPVFSTENSTKFNKQSVNSELVVKSELSEKKVFIEISSTSEINTVSNGLLKSDFGGNDSSQKVPPTYLKDSEINLLNNNEISKESTQYYGEFNLIYINLR